MAYVPPPPPGPGWGPPGAPDDATAYGYPAPPPKRTGLIVGIVGGITLVWLLCCGGLGGGAYLLIDAAQRQLTAPIDTYLTAVRGGDFDAAYAQLCAAEQGRSSADGLAAAWADRGAVEGWELGTAGEAADIDGGTVVAQPVTVRLVEGSSTEVVLFVRQDPETFAYQVCGEG